LSSEIIVTMISPQAPAVNCQPFHVVDLLVHRRVEEHLALDARAGFKLIAADEPQPGFDPFAPTEATLEHE